MEDDQAFTSPRCRERSDDAGGFGRHVDTTTLITLDNPPGSLRSPVPLERGTSCMELAALAPFCPGSVPQSPSAFQGAPSVPL